jgi:lipoyl(octanoyl) transferase
MQAFTAARSSDTPDEIWLTEHPPVYTLGLAGRPEHVIDARGIPVLRIDRGGQVTYHGPGQLLAYLLIDLRRKRYGVRELVRRIEQAVIDLLHGFAIAAERQVGMPGVYVDRAKISAVGLRVTRGCTYHGVALNVDPDLGPFAGINPCGYAGLATTSLAALGHATTIEAIAPELARLLQEQLRHD